MLWWTLREAALGSFLWQQPPLSLGYGVAAEHGGLRLAGEAMSSKKTGCDWPGGRGSAAGGRSFAVARRGAGRAE